VVLQQALGDMENGPRFQFQQPSICCVLYLLVSAFELVFERGFPDSALVVKYSRVDAERVVKVPDGSRSILHLGVPYWS
jgi:hypothetical protein